jgi:hypothetical protein
MKPEEDTKRKSKNRSPAVAYEFFLRKIVGIIIYRQNARENFNIIGKSSSLIHWKQFASKYLNQLSSHQLVFEVRLKILFFFITFRCILTLIDGDNSADT